MIRLGLVLLAALVAVPGRADANSCNLYQPQRFGEVRIGCPITVVALPEVEPWLPEITRNGTVLQPTLVQDDLTLEVAFEHYTPSDSCNLIRTSENRTFNRYVLTWDDLQAGDEVELDGFPYVVPSAGTCDPVEPFFYCQDPIQVCDYPDGDGTTDEEEAGCSATGDAPSWLALIPLLAFGRRRRR